MNKEKEEQSLYRQSINLPIAREFLFSNFPDLTENEKDAIRNYENYELELYVSDLFLKILDEAMRIQWVYSFSLRSWAKKINGYYYEIEVRSDKVFLKKMDDKESKCRELYSFYYEYLIEQEDGFYYEIRSNSYQLFAKKIDDKEHKCRDIYLFEYEHWLKMKKGYYYEIETCANEEFAKHMDDKEHKCRALYFLEDDSWLTVSNKYYYFELEAVINKAFIIEMSKDGSPQYIYCSNRKSAIIPDTWIGSLPHRNFKKIPYLKSEIWYDKETNSLYDENGVFISSLNT